MSEPRRILHVFRSPIGGLFRHVADLAREQAARGHDVGLFFDSSTANARTEAILGDLSPHLSLGIRRVPMRRNPDPRDVGVLRSLRTFRAEIRADVIHGHGSKGGAYARMLGDAARQGAIRAYTPHGGSFHFKPGNILHHVYSGIERMLARRTEVFLFESRYVAQCFEQFVGPTDKPAFVVHNGLHQHEFEPLDYHEQRHDLLYIGEMLMAKGVGDLLDALSILRAANRRLSLLAVGSGPDAQRLKDRAQALGLLDQVTFETPQPIRDVLARSRLMVMPSRAESLPYVLLEAGAAGHPLVSTNVGGIPEILQPVEKDLLAPGDSRSLAAAICASLDQGDDIRTARSASIARHLRTEFSIAHMTDAVLAGYSAGIRAAASRAGAPRR
jgi:glycosyltransferase involved in cell wall biosynthesis